jgi:ribosomal protein L14E/L6E/L27E
MNRYIVGKFDDSTFVVIDEVEQREICVCSNYDDCEDAEERAKKIVGLLNVSNEKTLG